MSSSKRRTKAQQHDHERRDAQQPRLAGYAADSAHRNQFSRSQRCTGNVAGPPYLRVCANQDQLSNSDSPQEGQSAQASDIRDPKSADHGKSFKLDHASTLSTEELPRGPLGQSRLDLTSLVINWIEASVRGRIPADADPSFMISCFVRNTFCHIRGTMNL
jgi:hypothetical protein